VTATLAIIRREWAAYFRTPVGWAVLGLFLALQGLVFWMFVQFLARPDAPPGGVMEFFFGGTILYWIALALLVTVLPMRLLAEERRSGTIEPLLTAPVAPIEVVLGKWLGAFGFFAASWAPTLLYVVRMAQVSEVDWRVVGASYLGVFAVGAGYLAIGTMTSERSSVMPMPRARNGQARSKIAALKKTWRICSTASASRRSASRSSARTRPPAGTAPGKRPRPA